MKAIILTLLTGLVAAVDYVPGSYIVQLKPGTSTSSHHRAVRHITRKRSSDPSTIQAFHIGDDFDGYVATSLTDADAAALAEREDVLTVEQDTYIYIDDFNSTEPEIQPRALTTQSPAGTWGLGDISHRQAGARDYVYDDSAGEGQTVYVLDTGIRLTHQDFEGRARFGFSGVTGGTAFEPDEQGHGTHVAGTAVGRTYGVAKKAEAVAVKVFRSSTGQSSWVLNGFNWAVSDIVSRNAAATSVINMSLGGSPSPALENAVRAAWAQGIVSLSAAGNEDRPASTSSPGRLRETITVGMTAPNRRRSQLIPGSFGSNYGPELDIFAPGQDILSASWQSDTGARTTSGTSMATPMVAGLVCYLRGLETGLARPEDVRARLVALGHKGVVTDAQGSPNVLAYNGSGR